MSSYHEEQESIENIKAWWDHWGGYVAVVSLLFAAAVIGWNGWHYWQRRQTAAAVVLYEQIEQASGGADTAHLDTAKITQLATELENRFEGTAYAEMGALLAARNLYAANDAAGAKNQLQWVIQHALNNEYRQLAQLHLASILLDEKSYAAALKLIDKPQSPAYAALFAERRGDVFAVQDKRDEARQAYQTALAALPSDAVALRGLLQFKLNALGGGF
jgi:predicted negative regulator of RcsB-dependent stress response